MVTILIVGFPETYKHFLETLQITNKLDKISFDELSELLATHDTTFGKTKQAGEDVLVTSTSKSLQVIIKRVMIKKQMNNNGIIFNIQTEVTIRVL